ncbi:hypothetical protein SAMN06265221_12724 [Paracoccus laeviglucosivorans]|uniref:Uncharacterized protein n=1 Tax=Paracoccus laeviglucosivorans TaxID=1197861 RepID=A0A521FP57_9RHOB|nr:hypothetical protein SAMN06265221_12724 [Paracoccus laeviglucosivorans]
MGAQQTTFALCDLYQRKDALPLMVYPGLEDKIYA